MSFKKYFLIFLALFFAISGYLFYKKLRGILPVITPAPSNPVAELDFLTVPDDFRISVFAQDLPSARVMAIDSLGNMWVSQTSIGEVSLIEIKNGAVKKIGTVFKNLNKPHGLAFDPDSPFMMYIAEEDKISRVNIYSEGELEKIADLPSGGGHFTRTIGFGPDKRLYVSIGSSCNVCVEKDERRAKIFSMNRDGGDVKEFARGLRNAVFFEWHPITGEIWATEMGRDFLGDNLPPDEINIIRENGNYGWPNCYGKNIHDIAFDKNTYIRNPCMQPFESSSHIDIQAHSAPLGLGFFTGDVWPFELKNNLLVSFHGSWNRSEPTGYKIMRYILGEDGEYLSEEEFITGWLSGNSVFGRPVDIKILPSGIIYMSDDKVGMIYKLELTD